MLSQAPIPFQVEMPICIVGQRNQDQPQVDLKLHGTNWNTDKPTFPRLAAVTHHMIDLIVDRLSKIPHVKRILIGRSGDVYHIWTLTDQWTAESRREIYEAQLQLLGTLGGFSLDFYVVRLDASDDVDTVAAGIPVAFARR